MNKTVKTVVFISNFFNHHQKPFSDAMAFYIGGGYHFIETETISQERLNMGWGKEPKPSYVLQNYIDEQNDFCQNLINEADVVIIGLGSSPYALINKRLKDGKLTFAYTERIYKKKIPCWKLPLHFLRFGSRYSYRNFYVLCASAYTALDFSRTLTFLGKNYKWGYFPAVKQYDNVDKLIERKKDASILWVARFIDWKHPEIPILIAKRLKEEGYTFSLNLIGNGALTDKIQNMIFQNDLSECVKMLGVMSPEQVREYMEESQIFMFTSDRNEGWGAVLNESMNSACAVVANSAIGSVPFLINDGENGYMYKDGDVDDLYHKVKKLLDDQCERERLAKNAYLTMINEWNAENAARKFIGLCERMLSGEYKPFPYDDGICSEAEILRDNWYKDV